MRKDGKQQRGYVNFPLTSEDYKSTGEGGLCVKLYVIEHTDKYDKGFGECCGVGCQDQYCETLLGEEAEKALFPRINDSSSPYQYISVPLLACVVLGSTSWSGFSDKKEDYWHCTYEDLNSEGKSIYNALHKLYGDTGEILLATFLDT